MKPNKAKIEKLRCLSQFDFFTLFFCFQPTITFRFVWSCLFVEMTSLPPTVSPNVVINVLETNNKLSSTDLSNYIYAQIITNSISLIVTPFIQ